MTRPNQQAPQHEPPPGPPRSRAQPCPARRPRRLSRAGAFASSLAWAALVLAAAGCRSTTPQVAPAATVTTGPTDGGDATAVDPGLLLGDGGALTGEPAQARKPEHVRLYIESEPTGLLPDVEGDVWGRRISLGAIYEPLVRPASTAAVGGSGGGNGDGSGGFDPVLADHWTVDNGGHRYLFYLREGARFHDGHQLASTDVAYTLDRVRSANYAKSHSMRLPAALADIERVELAGRFAVRLELRRPIPRLLETLSEIGIVPERGYEKGEAGHPSLGHRPVGTGPFRLDDWGRRRIALVRFEDYWGPKPSATRLDVVIEPDAARALYQAKRGEADVVGHLPSMYVPDQLDTPAISQRYQTVRVHAPRFAFILWNTAHPPLDDAAVRRALSQVVDRRRVLEEARHGHGRPIETVPAGEGPVPGKPDPAKAQAALDAAGLARGAGGVRARGGKPVRLTLLVPSGSREAEAAARLCADAIGRAGIPVDVVPSDMGTIVSRVRRGAYDGALLEWNGVDDDDLEPVLGSEGAWALGGFQSRVVDQLLESLRQLPAGDEKRRVRAQLANLVNEAQPALFLYGADETFLYARRLRPPVIEGDFFRLRDLGPR